MGKRCDWLDWVVRAWGFAATATQRATISFVLLSSVTNSTNVSAQNACSWEGGAFQCTPYQHRDWTYTTGDAPWQNLGYCGVRALSVASEVTAINRVINNLVCWDNDGICGATYKNFNTEEIYGTTWDGLVYGIWRGHVADVVLDMFGPACAAP